MPDPAYHRREATLEKLRRAMAKEKLDALLALSPENFYYASGWPSYFLYNYRTAGLAMAVIPYSEKQDPKIIISNFEYPAFIEKAWINDIRTYPIWVYIDESHVSAAKSDWISPIHKKASQGFGLQESFRLLSEILGDLDLINGHLGVEMGYIQHASWIMLNDYCPDAKFSDATDVWFSARAIKDPWEIKQLSIAGEVTQRAITKSSDFIKKGTTQEDVLGKFTTEALKDHRIDKIRFAFVRVGEFFAPAFFPRQDRAKIGALINYDVGIDCRGYCSDMARTFVLGKPQALHRKIFNVMSGAYEKALGSIEIGRSFSEIFEIAMSHVHSNGMPEYDRGHLGHSIGLGPGTEEPPFISANEHRPIQPGMVICLELPYYGHGIGAIMIEDMIVIKDTGVEVITDSSRDLIEL